MELLSLIQSYRKRIVNLPTKTKGKTTSNSILNTEHTAGDQTSGVLKCGWSIAMDFVSRDQMAIKRRKGIQKFGLADMGIDDEYSNSSRLYELLGWNADANENTPIVKSAAIFTTRNSFATE